MLAVAVVFLLQGQHPGLPLAQEIYDDLAQYIQQTVVPLCRTVPAAARDLVMYHVVGTRKAICERSLFGRYSKRIVHRAVRVIASALYQ